MDLAFGVEGRWAELENCVIGDAPFEFGLAEGGSKHVFDPAEVGDQPGCTGLADECADYNRCSLVATDALEECRDRRQRDDELGMVTGEMK